MRSPEANTETEVNTQEVKREVLLESEPGKEREGYGTGQRKKLGYHAVSTVTSASLMRSSEAAALLLW